MRFVFIPAVTAKEYDTGVPVDLQEQESEAATHSVPKKADSIM